MSPKNKTPEGQSCFFGFEIAGLPDLVVRENGKRDKRVQTNHTISTGSPESTQVFRSDPNAESVKVRAGGDN